MILPPTRAAALQTLAEFVPRADRSYASGRNIDPGPGQPAAVSRLSAYVRHRLITEPEIIAAVLSQHDMASAQMFIQEVLWRSYWKGWLEMRPSIWTRFTTERDRQSEIFANTPALAEALAGRTGIEGFDDWVRELRQTGYLHNHARMWFASIWIFTLQLPWTLGADFFLRHLIDADAASNTLSWRWVAGLQTPGKTYLASTDNIARYTNHRFAPKGLATEARVIAEPPIPPACALPDSRGAKPSQPAILLVTHEDMHPESLFAPTTPFEATVVAIDERLLWGKSAHDFVKAAAVDTAARAEKAFGRPATLCDSLEAESLLLAAKTAGVQQIITPYAPVGPVADALKRLAPALADEGVALVQARRRWDDQLWPHAIKGFFPFKARAMSILADGDLT